MLCMSQEPKADQSAISDHGGGKKNTGALKKHLKLFNKPRQKSSNTTNRTSSSMSSG